jgi:hypothetical protein
MGAERELLIEVDVGVSVPLVAGKAGCQQRLLQLRDLRYMEAAAVQVCAASFFRDEKFIVQWLVDDARNQFAILIRAQPRPSILQSQRDAEKGEAMYSVSTPRW